MNVSGPTYKKITPSIDKLSLPVVPRPQCNHMVGNVVYDKTVHSVPKKQNLFGHTNKIQLIIPILKKNCQIRTKIRN